MFDKWRKYSYVAQKQRRHHAFRVLLWLFLSFLFFTVVGTLFVSTVVAENATMEPGIRVGDRFLVSPFPYGARVPALSLRLPGLSSPERGDLVLVDRAPRKIAGFVRFADAAVRFFTGQRLALASEAERALALKRVVGLPGDTVSMNDHVIRVQAAGEPYGLTEFELSGRSYDVRVPKLPDGWTASLPLSGSFPPVVLKSGEYFLASDDRSAANDSRVWGPVSIDDIGAKVLFRYWPLPRFGRP